MTATHIRAVRIERGLTQEQVARQIGVTSTTVARWKRGERAPKGLYARAVEQWIAGE